MSTQSELPTVFVVEDEESFIEALEIGLKREGFKVHVARDGAEALSMFDGVKPDIVLLDETFGDTLDHGTGHLDLRTLPDVVAALRAHGVIGARTRVAVTHFDYCNSTHAYRIRWSLW